jgi:hypothetical protein
MKRYTCTCDPAKYNDLYVHSRQIVVDLPKWTIAVKERLRMNYSPKGIETTGCCCGHGVMPAWVSVHQAWYEDMFKLGYEQRPVEVVDGQVMGLYTFYL